MFRKLIAVLLCTLTLCSCVVAPEAEPPVQGAYPDPTDAEPMPPVPAEGDEAGALLVGLMSRSVVHFAPPEPATFEWNWADPTADVERVETVTVSGWQMAVANNLAEAPGEYVLGYFADHGFESDPYNTGAGTIVGITGMRRGDLVCLVRENVDEADTSAPTYSLEILCGAVPEGVTYGPVSGDSVPGETEDGDPVAELVAGNTAFALDLFGTLSDEEDNLFFSPYSISEALALAYAGARGDTADQMAETLHYTLSPVDLVGAFAEVNGILSSYSEKAGYQKGTQFHLQVANSCWRQEGYRFLPEYLAALEASDSGVGLRTTDFATAPDEARREINDWVAERTKDRIQDLLPAGSVDSGTRLVLANAIYFGASWRFPFDEGATETGAFHTLGGSEVDVPFMYQEERLRYRATNFYQAVELPYVGADVSMVVVMPWPGQWTAFVDHLDSDELEEIIDGLEYSWVHLSIPSYEIKSSVALEDVLPAMGMADAFKYGVADFSGMDGTHELFVGAARHKAFVNVDEEGTEAAAATALAMAGGGPPQLVEMTVDHPFLFLIRDRQTGTILCMGQVLDPSR